MSSYLAEPDRPDPNAETIITATLVEPRDAKSTPAGSPSTLENFINNFLREENIKWMSIIGAAIVLASSLMLVTKQWTTWSTELKYFTILAYTFATYYGGSIARSRLGLTTSGRVMELLSLLLMPLCFIALGLLDQAAFSGMPWIEKLLLIVPAIGLTYHASSRIFADILRGPQPTFLISYLLLSIAGALEPMSNHLTAGVFVLATWLIATIGVIKVNRHIFWLTEEAKHPRVFAFLPIALLGGMFLTLVATKALAMIELHWWGTVCVMFATTILLTARSAAGVFKQRTGNLVRPLPWSLMAPLVIGLVLMAAGVAFSCHGFSLRGPTTIAIIPTSLLVSGLLCVIAWDTGLSGFVWPALVMLTVAYQVSPVLFRSALLQLRDSAAAAMNESTLPLAFYGITYMPLVGMFIAVTAFCMRGRSRVSERLRVFARPTQLYVSGLMGLLFIAALTNLKALAIVAAIDAPVLLIMALAFRERLYAWLMLVSVTLCSLILFPFGHAMGWWDLAIAEVPTSVAGLGLLLALIPGLDRWLARIPSVSDSQGVLILSSEKPTVKPICVTLGYCLAFFAAIAWSTISVLELPSISAHFTIQWILIGAAFFMATLRTRDYLAALGFWSVTAIGSAVIAATWTLDFSAWSNCVSIGCAALTIGLMFVLQRCRRVLAVDAWRSIRMNSILLKPIEQAHRDFQDALSGTRPSYDDGGRVQLLATLSVALRDLSLAIALCLAALVLVPASIVANLGLSSVIPPVTILIMTVWGMVMTYAHRSTGGAAALASVAPLSLAAVMFGFMPEFETFEYKALAWTAVSAVTLLVTSIRPAGWLKPASMIGHGWLVATTVISLASTEPVFRAVGLVAVAAIAVYHWRRTDRRPVLIAAMVANVQLLLMVMYAAGVEGTFLGWMVDPQRHIACALLIPALAVSALVFEYVVVLVLKRAKDVRLNAGAISYGEKEGLNAGAISYGDERAFVRWWANLLRGVALLIAVSMMPFQMAVQPWFPVVLVGAALFIMGEFIRAIRTQRETYVWTGLAIIAASILWLASLGVLQLGVGVSQLVLAAAAAVGLLLHRLLSDKQHWQVFARPMFIVGMVCPGVLTAMAVFHQVASMQRVLDPIGTLTMFAAAFIYFHQSYVLKNKQLLLLSIGVLNLAVMLTWYGMRLNDAQFYCVPIGLSLIAIVQLLKSELPRNLHDPLRYVGALIVLVSPLFQIIDGSWIHLVSLLVLCVLVVLLAIGLRLRALLNVGTAFLFADLIMMVVRSSIDHPSLLWISGLGIGAAVILLAAICERHREQVLGRIRLLSAELATWN